MDYWRWFMSKVFGVRYVTLLDFDGECHVRRVYWRNGRAFAERTGYNISPIRLLDGGKTAGRSFVEGWEPYEPLAERHWPSPANTSTN